MSKIRILKATSFYQDFLDKVYFPVKYDEGKDYAFNYRSLMDMCYAWADFWKINLEAIGGFEMEETVINAEKLQKKWAREKNFRFSDGNWKQDIFTEQVRAFAPDVLVLQDVYHNAHFLQNIRKLVPSIKLIMGWDGILYHNKETFKDCDIVLSCVDESCDYYRANGFKTYFYRFGFETSILDKLKRGNPKHPVSFAGSLVMGTGYHIGRFDTIAYLARKTDIKLWVASFNYQWRYLSRHQIRRMMDLRFEFVRNMHAVGKKNQGPLFGLDMYQVLFDSLITFNSHGDNSPKKAANMRLYEATGVGTCLLTDWKENLNEFFEPDVEVVTYKNKKEAADKIFYLLDHEEERKKIALAGQKRTLENYSIRQTMAGIAELIRTNL